MSDHSAIEAALAFWREGARLLAQATAPVLRPAYEAAVGRVLARLQRCTTMAELVAFYGAADAEKLRWLETVCGTPDGGPLNDVLVEDAAFWRRAQQLIAANQDGG